MKPQLLTNTPMSCDQHCRVRTIPVHQVLTDKARKHDVLKTIRCAVVISPTACLHSLPTLHPLLLHSGGSRPGHRIAHSHIWMLRLAHLLEAPSISTISIRTGNDSTGPTITMVAVNIARCEYGYFHCESLPKIYCSDACRYV